MQNNFNDWWDIPKQIYFFVFWFYVQWPVGLVCKRLSSHWLPLHIIININLLKLGKNIFLKKKLCANLVATLVTNRDLMMTLNDDIFSFKTFHLSTTRARKCSFLIILRNMIAWRCTLNWYIFYGDDLFPSYWLDHDQIVIKSRKKNLIIQNTHERFHPK